MARPAGCLLAATVVALGGLPAQEASAAVQSFSVGYVSNGGAGRYYRVSLSGRVYSIGENRYGIDAILRPFCNAEAFLGGRAKAAGQFGSDSESWRASWHYCTTEQPQTYRVVSEGELSPSGRVHVRACAWGGFIPTTGCGPSQILNLRATA